MRHIVLPVKYIARWILFNVLYISAKLGFLLVYKLFAYRLAAP